MNTTSLRCEELSQFFDAKPRPDGFASLIDQPHGSFRCELSAVSGRSTNRPVQDNELLIRVVVSPRDMDRHNAAELGENCVLDVTRSGMSVLRADHHANVADEIRALAEFLVDRQANAIPDDKEAVCIGVIEFYCHQARNFPGPAQNQRMLGVYEVPEEKYLSHGEVLQAVNLYPSKTQSKNAARNFLEILRPRFILANAYRRANIAGISARGRKASP